MRHKRFAPQTLFDASVPYFNCDFFKTVCLWRSLSFHNFGCCVCEVTWQSS